MTRHVCCLPFFSSTSRHVTGSPRCDGTTSVLSPREVGAVAVAVAVCVLAVTVALVLGGVLVGARDVAVAVDVVLELECVVECVEGADVMAVV